MRIVPLAVSFCLLLGHTACAEPSVPPLAQDPRSKGAPLDMKTDSPEPWSDSGVAGLPFSRGHKFATLDSYLSYLEQYNGTIDMPWWREIEPGVYRYEVRMAGNEAPPEVATRAELEKRFGFTD